MICLAKKAIVCRPHAYRHGDRRIENQEINYINFMMVYNFRDWFVGSFEIIECPQSFIFYSMNNYYDSSVLCVKLWSVWSCGPIHFCTLCMAANPALADLNLSDWKNKTKKKKQRKSLRLDNENCQPGNHCKRHRRPQTLRYNVWSNSMGG